MLTTNPDVSRTTNPEVSRTLKLSVTSYEFTDSKNTGLYWPLKPDVNLRNGPHGPYQQFYGSKQIK